MPEWRDELDKGQKLREKIKELIDKSQSLFLLDGTYRDWEDKMKELAAQILKPGTNEVINEWEGGLSALDYIWNLKGAYSFKRGDPLPPKYRALDYYLGRKVEHIWGTGVLVKRRCGQYAIKVRLSCGTKGCKGRITVYAVPGCHNGAFCYVEDKDGNYQADLRNQWFKCSKCR